MAPELPSPDPGGASQRVVIVHAACTGSMRRAAFSRSSRPSSTRPPESAHSSSSSRSSETRRISRPPSRTATRAVSSIVPFTTTPPSRAENGGTSVHPPAKSRRTGAVAWNSAGRSRRLTAPSVYPGEERRELELPDRDLEADGSEPGLNHLLERRLPAPDGEQLERDMSAAEQAPRGVRVGGDRAHRDISRHVRRHRAVG